VIVVGKTLLALILPSAMRSSNHTLGRSPGILAVTVNEPPLRTTEGAVIETPGTGLKPAIFPPQLYSTSRHCIDDEKAHEEQDAAPLSEYVPEGHIEQLNPFAVGTEPTGQGIQRV
jgi:hypothetical protein